MAQRQYEQFTLFNVRIVDMRHLWTPSTMYKGQQQQKPNWFAGFITPKTQQNWGGEPALAGLVQGLLRLHANNPQITDWRIEDGDRPNAEGKSSDFAKGHWLFGASSSNPVNVEMVQAGGTLVKLQNKVGVKSGDFCMLGGSCAVSGQNTRAAKLYLNAVVFTAPGEEIVFANSVSGTELMQQAQRQGLQVAGFTPAHHQFAQPGHPTGFAPHGGFPGGAPQGAPGFPGQQQFGAPAPAGGPATYAQPQTPGQFTQPPGGSAPGLGGLATAYPSNPQQYPNPGQQQYPQQNGFGQPPGFNPGGAFPGR